MSNIPQNPDEVKFELRDLRNGDWLWVNKAIMEHPNLSSSGKMVYISLAYFANCNTQKCYPSIGKISELTKLSRRTVQRSLKDLQKYGFIFIERNEGEINEYTLLSITENKLSKDIIDRMDTPAKLTGVSNNSGGVCQIEGERGCQIIHTNNNSINNNKLTITSGFQRRGGEPSLVGDILKDRVPPNPYVTKEFQSYGLYLAKGLGIKNPSALIKAAKEIPRGILEAAYSFAIDYPAAKDKQSIFFWKVKELNAKT